jgi:hypothetical protein
MEIPKRRSERLAFVRTLDPKRDHHAVYRITALYEFPGDVRIGLLLAFWRTFAIPSIATLLDATGETTLRTRKRADDTGILMYELINHGFDHRTGRAVVRRLNQIHRRFKISNDDFLYVLGTFVFVPTRWIDRYGWRRLCCHERVAMFHFYCELGRRMNIRDLPSSPAEFEAFFDAFECEHFLYTDAAARLMHASRSLLASLSAPLRPASNALISALLDPPLRAATGTPDPPRIATAALDAALTARGRWQRWRPPRKHPLLTDGIKTGTYLNGYDIARVGPTRSDRP